MSKKTILITGGSKGIGLATAQMCLARGFRVILLARGEVALAEAKRDMITQGHSGGGIETAVIDMADADALAARVPKLALLQDGLFGLVNNAASEILRNVTEFSRDEMESMWRVNMLAPVVMIQACYPFLRRAGGSIVNVGSISDEEHYERYSVYGASKSFLRSFTQHACKELGRDGVRINSVSPGGVDTPLMREVEKTFPPEEIRAAKQKIPIEQRWGRSEEVAEVILFALTGPAYLHGADLRVHGGGST